MNMRMRFRHIIASILLVMLAAGPLMAQSQSNAPDMPAQGAEVTPLIDALKAILSSRASQYNAHVDTIQAKLFQIGETSAVIAPVTELSLVDLGLLGLLEVGGSFTVQGTELPPGSYRMELGGTLQQMQLYLRDSFGNRVLSIPVQFSSNITFYGTSNQIGASSWFRRPSTPVAALQVIGPNININFGLTRTPPYVQNVRTCIGFLIPFSSGSFTIQFCL